MKALSTSITRSFSLTFILLSILGALGEVGGVFPQAATAVNTTSDTDDGACDAAHCSLREAINASNASRDRETITFSIPAATDAGCNAVTGVCTIRPTSQLPTISDQVTIDGYTQPGATPNTNPTGAINAVLKIELDGSNAGEFANALVISASSCTVRGLVINRFRSTSGFGGVGIFLTTQGGNQIMGNFIGTDVAGLADLGNGSAGVIIGSAADQLRLSNLLGGTTPDARNLISGNGFGVTIEPTGFHDAKGNIVQGNLIGTDKTGAAALGNDQFGLRIFNAFDNTIGGTTEAERNVISGNGNDGIVIASSSSGFAMGNVVQGNYIGIDASGTQPLGNGSRFTTGDGIDIEGRALNNTISDNIIAFNPSNGIEVQGPNIEEGDPGIRENRISGNSIFSNGGLGIDLRLGTSGAVTPNDPGDIDIGPNNLQNFPVLTSASTTGNATTMSGALNSTPNTQFRIEFFSNTACDQSGFGEGQTFIGFQNVTTDGNGNATVDFLSSSAIAATQFITATATDPNGNTSEFSQCMREQGPDPPTPASQVVYLPLVQR